MPEMRASDSSNGSPDTAIRHLGAAPWYFTTPVVILCLLFCWPIGLLTMWVGKVWPTWVRALVTCLVITPILAWLLMSFIFVRQATNAWDTQFNAVIDQIQNMPTPPASFPHERYYEEWERGEYPERREESAPLLTPSAQPAGTHIQLGLWTWVNETSPEAIRIEGTVKNNMADAFTGLKAYVTVEDANGLLLGVGSAPLSPETLPGGGTSEFVVRITDAQCTTDSLSISCRFEY